MPIFGHTDISYRVKGISMDIINVSSGYMSANTYILKDTATGDAALVDPGGDSEYIISQINANAANVKCIFLTHGHFDHILALDRIREYTGARVYIHALDNVCLGNPTFSLMTHIGRSDTFGDADVLLDGGEEIEVGESRVRVMHTPGHTVGSVCFITDSGIISGDTLFYESIGRTDFPGGSFEAIEASIKELYAIEGDAAVYPGHGRATSLEHERKFNPYVSDRG